MAMNGFMNPGAGKVDAKLNAVPSHAKKPAKGAAPGRAPGAPARAVPPGRVASRMPPRMPPREAPRAGPKQAQGAPTPPAAPKASPEDQAAFNQFVQNGIKLIYNKAGMAQLVKSLDGGGNPAEGLANTLAMIVQRLVDSGKQNGAVFSPAVILHGAGELMKVLADLSKESGGHAYTDQELATLVKQIIENIGQPPPGQDQDQAQAAPPGPPNGAPGGAPPPGGGDQPMMGFPGQ